MLQHKKANALILVVIIIVVISISVTILIIASQKGWFDRNEEQKYKLLDKFYLIAFDSNLDSTDANYVLEDSDGLKISEGKLSEDSFTEIDKVPITMLSLYCWNDEHYLTKVFHILSQEEINQNLSKRDCNMVGMGNVNVTLKGEITNGISELRLNISTDKWLYAPQVCISWTSGITYVIKKQDVLRCKEGFWVNWSYQNITTKKYTYLNQGLYRCGKCDSNSCDWVEECEQVKEDICKPKRIETPLRFKGKVDSCTSLSSHLFNTSIEIPFEVKAQDLNYLDSINFYIFDRDRRFSPIDMRWMWFSEYNGENIGLPEDIKVTYNYG